MTLKKVLKQIDTAEHLALKTLATKWFRKSTSGVSSGCPFCQVFFIEGDGCDDCPAKKVCVDIMSMVIDQCRTSRIIVHHLPMPIYRKIINKITELLNGE